MRKLLKLTLILTTFVFVSCKNRSNIELRGQITEQGTNKVISNAEVLILCWYTYGLDDATYEKKTIRTDENGRFSAHFDKGYDIVVTSKHIGFNPTSDYKELQDNKIVVNLKLNKSEQNKDLRSLINSYENMDSTFLRVRVYYDKLGKKLNFKDSKIYGFDFKTMSIITDTLNMDIWFETIKDEKQPTVIRTNKLGGVIPIFHNEVKSSLFFEKTTAPISGYLTTYKLQKNELGFFIKNRDGNKYGKMIWENSEIDNTGQEKGKHFKEFGKTSNYLFQPNGTTNLSYPNTDIDLEEFQFGRIK